MLNGWKKIINRGMDAKSAPRATLKVRSFLIFYKQVFQNCKHLYSFKLA